jgi:antitoxin component YwqK of YwqJK toxin-antitoxin module
MNITRIISAGALLLLSSPLLAQTVRQVISTPNAEHTINKYNNIVRIDEESKPFTGKYIVLNAKKEKMLEHNYVNGILEGRAIESYIKDYDTVPYFEVDAFYKNGKLHGKYLKYDKMNDIVYVTIEANYKNGILHGHYTESLTPYGKTKECDYVNGELDGKWISYSKLVSTGIDCIQYYKSGYRDSICIWFLPNGKPKTIMHYNKKGDEHGLRQEFYKDGTIQSEIDYVNNSKHGQWKEYYKNGKLQRLINYVNGRKQGQEKEYYEDGQLARLTNFIRDQKNGEETLYFKSGKVKEKKFFKMDSKAGKWTWYNEDGSIKEETEYRLE